jgi:hypothetical protein
MNELELGDTCLVTGPVTQAKALSHKVCYTSLNALTGAKCDGSGEMCSGYTAVPDRPAAAAPGATPSPTNIPIPSPTKSQTPVPTKSPTTNQTPGPTKSPAAAPTPSPVSAVPVIIHPPPLSTAGNVEQIYSIVQSKLSPTVAILFRPALHWSH